MSREAFEAWGGRAFDADFSQFRNGAYPDGMTDFAWDAWQAATKAERERCAKIVEAEHVGKSVYDGCGNDSDSAYNRALRHAAASIRAD